MAKDENARRQEAYRECTRDPIFLFQKNCPQWLAMPDGWATDGDSWWNEAGETASEREMCDRMKDHTQGDYDAPYVQDVWVTERAFLTRAEGEQFGRRHHYNYPVGWRVYCVPCEGELAAILCA